MGMLYLTCTAVICCTQINDAPNNNSVTKTHHLIKQGQSQLKNGDYSGSVASFRMVLHQDSVNVSAIGGLSQAYKLQQKSFLADIYKRRAANFGYDSGLTALTKKDTSKAAIAFQATLDIEPRHPLALIGLGQIAFAEGENEQALDFFKRATEVNAKYSAGFVYLGDALSRLSRFSDARLAYEQAISLNIKMLDAYIGLGNALIILGKNTLAVEQFDTALLINQKSEEAKMGRTRALQHR